MSLLSKYAVYHISRGAIICVRRLEYFWFAPEILNQAEFVCYQWGRGLSATWAVDICRSVFTLLFDLLRKVVGPPCCSLGEETNIAETRIVQALFNNDRVVEGGGRGGGAKEIM